MTKNNFNNGIFHYVNNDVHQFINDENKQKMKIKMNIYENNNNDFNVHDYSITYPLKSKINTNHHRPFESDVIYTQKEFPINSNTSNIIKLDEEILRNMNEKEKNKYILKIIEKFLTTKYEKQIVYFISNVHQKLKKFGNDVIFVIKGGHAIELGIEYINHLLSKNLNYLKPSTSDWDTGIFINPNLTTKKWNEIFEEINIIITEEMGDFNKEFTKNYKSQIEQINNKYFSIETNKSTKIERLSQNRCINRNCEKIKNNCKCSKHIPYIFSESYNFTLPDFILHRLKFNINMKNKQYLIECIDISFETKSSEKLKNIWNERFSILYNPIIEYNHYGFDIPIPSLEFLNIEEQRLIDQAIRLGPTYPDFRKLEKRRNRVKNLNEAMCYIEGTVFDGKKIDYNELEKTCVEKNVQIPNCNINPIVNKWILDTTNKQDLSKNKLIDLILKLVSKITPIYFKNEKIAKNKLISFRKYQLCNILVWYFKLLYNYLDNSQMTDYLNIRFTQTNNKKYDYLGEVEVYLVTLIDYIDKELSKGRSVSSEEILNWEKENKEKIIVYFLHRIFGICIKKNLRVKLEKTLRYIRKSFDKNTIMMIIGGEAIKQYHPNIFESPDYDIEIIINKKMDHTYKLQVIRNIYTGLDKLKNELTDSLNIDCFTSLKNVKYKFNTILFELKHSSKIVFYVTFIYNIKNQTKTGVANLFEIQIFNQEKNGTHHAMSMFNNKNQLPFENIKNLTNDINGLPYASLPALRSEYNFREGKRWNPLKGYIDIIRSKLINPDN